MFAARNAARSLTEARAIHETAETAHRDLTTEERSRYDALMASARQYTTDAEREDEATRALARFHGDPVMAAFRPVVADAAARRSARPDVERRAIGPHVEQAVLVPSWAEYRAAQAEGTDPAGGFTVPVQQSSTIVERLQPASVLLAAGPRVFVMSSDSLRIPKIGTGVTAAMVAENAPIPETNIVFDAVGLTARKIAGFVRSSNEWLADSVPDARSIVETDLLRELARKLDEQFFAGSGTPPDMTGLLHQAGITSTPLVGTIDLDGIAAAIERIEADGGTPSAIFMSSATWGALRVAKDGDTRYMLNPDPSGEASKRLFGVTVFVTPYVEDAVIVADMAMVAVGVRDHVTMFFDPSRFAEYDQSLVRMTARFDIGVLHAAGVEIITPGALAARAKPAVTSPARKA
jgi:HK97 family phage major capsid protein